ncbi:uncharacterized protein RG961_008428 [Leptosomus discolor]
MAAPRRVSFTTLKALKSSLAQPGKDSGEEPQSSKTAAKTARITVNLFEPDDKRCPEFYYPDLVKSCEEKGEGGSAGDKKKDPVDPFNDEEKERQEVEALARKFEEKYGGKRRRKDRIQDLADMGYGYDESDSFIDNSEAYDEYVPACLTTQHGGFYVNSGKLEFRLVSDSEEDFVKEEKKQRPKKRKLEDGGEKMKKQKKKKRAKKEQKEEEKEQEEEEKEQEEEEKEQEEEKKEQKEEKKEQEEEKEQEEKEQKEERKKEQKEERKKEQEEKKKQKEERKKEQEEKKKQKEERKKEQEEKKKQKEERKKDSVVLEASQEKKKSSGPVSVKEMLQKIQEKDAQKTQDEEQKAAMPSAAEAPMPRESIPRPASAPIKECLSFNAALVWRALFPILVTIWATQRAASESRRTRGIAGPGAGTEGCSGSSSDARTEAL